jgi:putative oxidoreductase
MQTPRLTRWIPAILILLFAYTGVSKLLDLDSFTSALYNQPIPRAVVPFLTITLPCLEIVTAAALLFNRTRQIALYSALILLFIFTLYIAAILLRFFDWIPCSCGGIFRHLTWGQHLCLNLALLILTAIAAYSNKPPAQAPAR